MRQCLGTDPRCLCPYRTSVCPFAALRLGERFRKAREITLVGLRSKTSLVVAGGVGLCPGQDLNGSAQEFDEVQAGVTFKNGPISVHSAV